MADLLYLTEKPVRVTAATIQELRLAVDVTRYNTLDLMLTVYEGTSVVVKLITGTQLESETGWVDVDATTPAFATTTAVAATKRSFTGMLAYVRWQVTSSGNATFMVQGIGRLK